MRSGSRIGSLRGSACTQVTPTAASALASACLPSASHSDDPLVVSEEVDEKDRIMDMMDEDEEFQFAFGAYIY